MIKFKVLRWEKKLGLECKDKFYSVFECESFKAKDFKVVSASSSC